MFGGAIAQNIPDVDFLRYVKDFMEIITSVLQQATNFLYLCIGEAIYPMAGWATFLLLYKYTIFPIGVIVRRIFVKGGDT